MSLRAWIEARQPPVPEAFRGWMEPSAPLREASVEALADEAAAALERAVGGDAHARDGAFDLLVADGFLTWACELAVDSDHAETALDQLVRRFAS